MVDAMPADVIVRSGTPCEKRTLEHDDTETCAARKAPKIDLLHDGRLPAGPLRKSTPEQNDAPKACSDAISSSAVNHNCTSETSGSSSSNDALCMAKKEIRTLFREQWLAYALERDGCKGDGVTKSDSASLVAEKIATEKYTELRDALVGLLPWLGPLEPAATMVEGCSYDAVQFQGMQPPKHLCRPNVKDKKGKEVTADVLQRGQLEWFRTLGERASAWESLTEVLSAIASRAEMNWLEGLHIADDIPQKLKKIPGCRSPQSEKRKAWIRDFLLNQEQYGVGNFIAYLMTHGATVRVAFKPSVPRHIPATVLITHREPLWDALLHQDDEGPIVFSNAHPETNKEWTTKQKRQWLMQAGRQFTFQLANLDEDEEDPHKSRVPGKDLEADPKLLALLRSRKPAVQLEVIAALAPKDVMKGEGLSELVKSELTMVMHEAKSRGEAVVFCLGSTSPHILAKKVYLRAPIGDCGLQCGYLRWRNSPELPWARERKWDDRICLCLQMP